MATASRHLCRSLARLSSRPPTRRKWQSLPQRIAQPSPFRQLSTTSFRLATQEEAGKDIDFGTTAELQVPAQPYTAADLDPTERAHYETLTKDEQKRYLALQNHAKAIMEGDEMAVMSEEELRQAAREIDRSGVTQALNFVEERDLLALRDGLWQEDEDDEFGQVPDNDDDVSEDLITSVAESELEVHREVREYTRLSAWDLPLLLQFAKPFSLPDTKKTPLRFRYTTYLGESHPAARKVVVQFTTRELATATTLSEAQRIKFIKLVGVRYNPDKDVVKISCEKFDTPAQNKRYLGDLINNIIKEAQNTEDMFEDVPLDFRHHKPKKIPIFPESWKVNSEEGVKRLRQKRVDVQLLLADVDPQAEEQGLPQRPVDGRELVEMYVASKAVRPPTPTNQVFARR